MLTSYDVWGGGGGRSTEMPSGEIDSKQLMIQALSRKLESIPLMIQTAFQELTQNQLMTQVHLPDIDSATHD